MEIEFRPIKKIVILEELKCESVEDLFANLIGIASPDSPITLMWSNGVLFTRFGMPMELSSEEVTRDRLSGIIYWSQVVYAKMEKYESEKTFGMHTFKIVEVKTPAVVEVAKKLKERLEE